MSDTSSSSDSAQGPKRSGERPSGYRSAAYSRVSIARLVLSEKAHHIAGFAGFLVPTAPGPHYRDGQLVSAAVGIAENAEKLVALAVICERVNGVGWERIGEALGGAGHRAARERYEEAERDFHEQVLRAWLYPDHAGDRSASAPDHTGDRLIIADCLAPLVTRLNAWLTAHRECDAADDTDDAGDTEDTGDTCDTHCADDADPYGEPIDSGLTPMSITERSTMIAQAASLLQAMATDPGADARRRHELETGLLRRAIELYEDLTVRNPGDADALTNLADTRTRLAELTSNGAP